MILVSFSSGEDALFSDMALLALLKYWKTVRFCWHIKSWGGGGVEGYLEVGLEA